MSTQASELYPEILFPPATPRIPQSCGEKQGRLAECTGGEVELHDMAWSCEEGTSQVCRSLRHESRIVWEYLNGAESIYLELSFLSFDV